MINEKDTAVGALLLAGVLLLVAVAVDSLRRPTKDTTIIVRGTHVDLEPLEPRAVAASR